MELVIIGLVIVAVLYFGFFRDRGSSSTTPVTPAPAPAPKVVADANGNGITSKAELKKLTKVQLIELADKQNLKVKKSGTKAAVINEIHAQLRDQVNDSEEGEEL